MAKAKAAKGKAKGGGFKDVLLKKGEYIALGVGGVGLVLFLLMGVVEMSAAGSPDKLAGGVTEEVKRIDSAVNNPSPPPPEKLGDEFVVKPSFPTVPTTIFPTPTVLFDPIRTPDNKRENPLVVGIEQVQVDLVRAPMPAFDKYTENGKTMIGVVKTRQVKPADRGVLTKTFQNLQPKTGGPNRRPPAAPPRPPAPPAGGADTAAATNPLGGSGSTAYDGGSPREEKAVDYISLDQFGSPQNVFPPAVTVVPLRLVVVHATIPLKKQWEEIRKALRLKTLPEAAAEGPVFDGYEARRRVTGPRGVVQNWAPFDVEGKYVELINSRKLADHPDDPDPAKPYLRQYFLPYADGLALPLPLIDKDLGKYPDLRLKAITDAVDKLVATSKPVEAPNALAERLRGKNAGRADLIPKSGADTGGNALFGGRLSGGEPPPAVAPVPGGPAAPGTSPYLPDQEDLLLRMIDADVQPGLTYEYQVRLRMKNPNFGKKELVANPQYAAEEILIGPWVQIDQPQKVPAEEFVYAADTAEYQKSVLKVAGGDASLTLRMEARDKGNPVADPIGAGKESHPRQAVVEYQKWVEQVRTEGGRREPLGAWVVGEMPVTRGEFVGKRQFLKLPLWSSEEGRFAFRKVAQAAFRLPPKVTIKNDLGWVFDFSTKAILADFVGGKVAAQVGNRTVSDEAATEMLVVQPDGKLLVRNSAAAATDADRVARRAIWDKWVADVEAAKSAAPGTPGGAGSLFTTPGKP